MPTNEEFSRVNLGSGEQSYKQTERESRSGEFAVQGLGENLPDASSGNYPRTFDNATGQDYAASGNDYPMQYVRVNTANADDPSSYKRNEQQSVGGEYGWVHGQTLPEAGSNQVPTPTKDPRIFSSDVNGDPKALLASTQSCVDDHASVLMAHGLTQPIATVGSHPWLRDSLANPGVKEPGNAQPGDNLGIPFKGKP